MTLHIRLEFEWIGTVARWLVSRMGVMVTLNVHDAAPSRNRFRDSPGVTGWKSGTRIDSPSFMGPPKAQFDK